MLVPIGNQIQGDLKDLYKKKPCYIAIGRCFPYVVRVRLKYI